VPPLAAVLKDADAGVRKAAATSLGKLGAVAKETTAALTELLKDNDKSVQDAAREALSKIAGEKTNEAKESNVQDH
jgi:HEAT repeat protein